MRAGTRGSQPKAFTERQLKSSSLTAYSLLPTVYFYHTDHLGSPRIITNLAGEKVAEYEYLPFGFQKNGKRTVTPFAFTGKPKDEESGLQYFGARYYTDYLRRFTSPDPILSRNFAQPNALNRYLYSNNNPLRFFDPDGRYYLKRNCGYIEAWSRTREEAREELIARSLIPGYALIKSLYAKINVGDPRVKWSDIIIEGVVTVASLITPGSYEMRMVISSVEAAMVVKTGINLFTEAEMDKIIFQILEHYYPGEVHKGDLPLIKGKYMFRIKRVSPPPEGQEVDQFQQRENRLKEITHFVRLLLIRYGGEFENFPKRMKEEYKNYWRIYEQIYK